MTCATAAVRVLPKPAGQAPRRKSKVVLQWAANEVA